MNNNNNNNNKSEACIRLHWTLFYYGHIEDKKQEAKKNAEYKRQNANREIAFRPFMSCLVVLS